VCKSLTIAGRFLSLTDSLLESIMARLAIAFILPLDTNKTNTNEESKPNRIQNI